MPKAKLSKLSKKLTKVSAKPKSIEIQKLKVKGPNTKPIHSRYAENQVILLIGEGDF